MNTVLNNTYITGKKENRESEFGFRVMRLFVLSSGYVAAFTNSGPDETYWGSSVIPLGFGAEVSAQRAVDIMQSANPHNLVTFAGGLQEYREYISR